VATSHWHKLSSLISLISLVANSFAPFLVHPAYAAPSDASLPAQTDTPYESSVDYSDSDNNSASPQNIYRASPVVDIFEPPPSTVSTFGKPLTADATNADSLLPNWFKSPSIKLTKPKPPDYPWPIRRLLLTWSTSLAHQIQPPIYRPTNFYPIGLPAKIPIRPEGWPNYPLSHPTNPAMNSLVS